MEKQQQHAPHFNHILLTQLFVPMITIFEFFSMKKEERGEKKDPDQDAKCLASLILMLCFWSYHFFYDIPGPLYSMHQLKRRLNSLLVGCIFYSAVQIPLSFVLNSDYWIDYLFIVSLNLCFSIFFIKYSHHLSILRIKHKLSYFLPMYFIVGMCGLYGELYETNIEYEERSSVAHCQLWTIVFLISIVDWFLTRWRLVRFVPPGSEDYKPPISVVSSAFYNIV